jgi:hypothetical protein
MTAWARPFHGRRAAPSPRLRGEGWGEGALPQIQTCGGAETFPHAQTRGYAPSSRPSPRKRGEGAGCGQWRFLAAQGDSVAALS